MMNSLGSGEGFPSEALCVIFFHCFLFSLTGFGTSLDTLRFSISRLDAGVPPPTGPTHLPSGFLSPEGGTCLCVMRTPHRPAWGAALTSISSLLVPQLLIWLL